MSEHEWEEFTVGEWHEAAENARVSENYVDAMHCVVMANCRWLHEDGVDPETIKHARKEAFNDA